MLGVLDIVAACVGLAATGALGYAAGSFKGRRADQERRAIEAQASAAAERLTQARHEAERLSEERERLLTLFGAADPADATPDARLMGERTERLDRALEGILSLKQVRGASFFLPDGSIVGRSERDGSMESLGAFIGASRAAGWSGAGTLRRVSLHDSLGHELSWHTIDDGATELKLGAWATGRALPKIAAAKARLQLGDAQDAQAERVVRARTALPAEVPAALHKVSSATPLLGVALWEVNGETWINWGEGVGEGPCGWAEAMISYGEAFVAARRELGLGGLEALTVDTLDRRRLGVHVLSAGGRRWAALFCFDGAEIYPHARMGGWLGQLARELEALTATRTSQPSQPGARL